MSKLYLEIDIGETVAEFEIINELGERLCKDKYLVNFDAYETPILTTVLRCIDKFLYIHNYDYWDLCGIGISVTEQIDAAAGSVSKSSGNTKNWEEIKLQEALSHKYQLPVTVLNDANCAGLREE